MATVHGGRAGVRASGQGAQDGLERSSEGRSDAMAAALAAIVRAGGSRQVVAAAMAAGMRSLVVSDSEAEDAREQSASGPTQREVDDRLQALRVVLTAQAEAAEQGMPARSSRGLVDADDHILANAARHEFGTPFRQVTPASARKAQRGKRRGDEKGENGEKGPLEHETRTMQRLADVEQRLARLEGLAAPDALGVWLAEAAPRAPPEAAVAAAEAKEQKEGNAAEELSVSMSALFVSVSALFVYVSAGRLEEPETRYVEHFSLALTQASGG